MIDIKILRENPDKVKKACADKRADIDIDKILELDKKRRQALQEVEGLKAEKNKLGKEDAEKGKQIKERIKALEPELEQVETELNDLFSQIPNLPMDDVPVGRDENDNKVLRTWGDIPKFDFKPKDHIELGKTLDIIDTETAGKISGTRFGYLKGDAALMEFALVRFVFDVLGSEKTLKKIADGVEKGYSSKPFVPVVPPVMIKPEAANGKVKRAR